MESVALNFAHRFINDGKARISYINQTRKLAQEYRAKISSGAITAEEAAKQVQGIRNQILEAQRLRTSDVGKAIAVKLKKTGLTLPSYANVFRACTTLHLPGFSYLSPITADHKYTEHQRPHQQGAGEQ